MKLTPDPIEAERWKSISESNNFHTAGTIALTKDGQYVVYFSPTDIGEMLYALGKAKSFFEGGGFKLE